MSYIEQNRARIKRYMQERDATDAGRLAKLACNNFGIYTGFGLPEIMLEIAREVLSDD